MKEVVKEFFLRSQLVRIILSRVYRTLVKLQGLFGQQLLVLMPARAETIKRDEFSFTTGRKRNWLDSLLRAGLIEQAMSTGQSSTLEKYHYDFWQGERGHQYHSERQNRFEEIFLRHYAYLVDEINALVANGQIYTTLCEIGSGSGQLLDYLAESIPEVDRFVGIDLSEETTSANQQTYTNPKLEFVAAGGLEWIEEHGQPNWIFLTHGGVLEYFSQANLELLLDHISQSLAPAIFVAIEPVAVDHDLTTELDSKPYGREFAFSHNYPHLFDKANFQIKHMKYSHERLGHYLYAFVAVTNDES